MTTQLPKLSELTNEQVRVIIATRLGWTEVQIFPGVGVKGRDPKTGTPEHVPNYPQDLNACAEMEATLEQPEWIEYDALLDYINMMRKASATARQRCDAFLLTHELAVL